VELTHLLVSGGNNSKYMVRCGWKVELNQGTKNGFMCHFDLCVITNIQEHDSNGAVFLASWLLPAIHDMNRGNRLGR